MKFFLADTGSDTVNNFLFLILQADYPVKSSGIQSKTLAKYPEAMYISYPVYPYT